MIPEICPGGNPPQPQSVELEVISDLSTKPMSIMAMISGRNNDIGSKVNKHRSNSSGCRLAIAPPDIQTSQTPSWHGDISNPLYSISLKYRLQTEGIDEDVFSPVLRQIGSLTSAYGAELLAQTGHILES